MINFYVNTNIAQTWVKPCFCNNKRQEVENYLEFKEEKKTKLAYNPSPFHAMFASFTYTHYLKNLR